MACMAKRNHVPDTRPRHALLAMVAGPRKKGSADPSLRFAEHDE